VDELLIEPAPVATSFPDHPQLEAALQAALWAALTETLARVRLPVTAAPPAARPAPKSLRVPLSAREQQVLACVAAGDSNKLIARTLGLSLHTVKRHVANILVKLDVDSRGQAAAWWLSRP